MFEVETKTGNTGRL